MKSHLCVRPWSSLTTLIFSAQKQLQKCQLFVKNVKKTPENRYKTWLQKMSTIIFFYVKSGSDNTKQAR